MARFTNISLFEGQERGIYRISPTCEIEGIVVRAYGDGTYEIKVDEKHTMIVNGKMLKRAN